MTNKIISYSSLKRIKEVNRVLRRMQVYTLKCVYLIHYSMVNTNNNAVNSKL